MDVKRNRYEGLNGLKAISCFGIIAMHIMANSDLNMAPFFRVFIGSWTQLVYLFLIISAFGMCCGYFSKIKNREIDMEAFYKRRYSKMLPFFLGLIVIDIIIEHTRVSVIEGLTEVTMLFGFLPNNDLSVIGVSWTLGVIFVFYFIFPFFTVILSNKKRAWSAFAVSIVINYFCSLYFFSSKFVIKNFPFRHSFIYCIPFFVLGGILFLYKDELVNYTKNNSIFMFILCCVSTALFYLIPNSIFGVNIFVIKLLIVFMFWLVFSIGSNSIVLNNKFIHFFSSISMEMYLAQMVIFRLIEKLNLLYLFGHGLMSLLFIFIIEIIGLVMFIQGYRYIYSIIFKSLFTKN